MRRLAPCALPLRRAAGLLGHCLPLRASGGVLRPATFRHKRQSRWQVAGVHRIVVSGSRQHFDAKPPRRHATRRRAACNRHQSTPILVLIEQQRLHRRARPSSCTALSASSSSTYPRWSLRPLGLWLAHFILKHPAAFHGGSAAVPFAACVLFCTAVCVRWRCSPRPAPSCRPDLVRQLNMRAPSSSRSPLCHHSPARDSSVGKSCCF